MSRWKSWLTGGPASGESREQYVRRLGGKRNYGYDARVLPSVVELYDRIAALEQRVQLLESNGAGTAQ